MAEKTRHFEILKQPYLCNYLTNFYRTKTKLYVKASSIIVYGKENEGNNLKFWCNMPINSPAHPCMPMQYRLPIHCTCSNVLCFAGLIREECWYMYNDDVTLLFHDWSVAYLNDKADCRASYLHSAVEENYIGAQALQCACGV